jgi:hypothetical protein
MDIIVMPESCDVPALAHTREDFIVSTTKYNQALLDKASETAKRCNAVIFLNGSDEVLAFWDGFSKGTKFVIDYCKKHGKKITVVIKKQ